MSIPKYYEIHKPFLECLKDNQVHHLKEIKKYVIAYFKLTKNDLDELLPSGRQTVFPNRVGWASTYLKKAGLITSPSRAKFKITQEGKNVLNENPDVIDNNYLMKYESFREFASSGVNSNTINQLSVNSTPDDIFESSFIEINENLADELLNEVVKLSSVAFEKMIIDLLLKMGYGSFENSSKMTSLSSDEGIDGIIMEDKLGFSLIYIQAKKWNPNSQKNVGRPDLQSFVGAISGKSGKGLFVTTTKFSQPAIDYAADHHIILIDGEKLSKLMIEYNFGVSVKKTFEIKVIDTDTFNEYSENRV